MSMNLYCNGFDVIQTPTYITYMIYDDGAGGMCAVKRRYINYIKYLRQDQFNKANKQEEQQDIWDGWTEHINNCLAAGKLTFEVC